MGFSVLGLGFRRFGAWSLGLRVWGLGFRLIAYVAFLS